MDVSKLEKSWPALIKEGQPLTFKKGQALFYEGHSPYGIFLIQSGEVEFWKEDGNTTQDNHRYTIPQGEIIGLDVFASDEVHCCTCMASEDCQAVFISKTQLLPFFENH